MIKPPPGFVIDNEPAAGITPPPPGFELDRPEWGDLNIGQRMYAGGAKAIGGIVGALGDATTAYVRGRLPGSTYVSPDVATGQGMAESGDIALQEAEQAIAGTSPTFLQRGSMIAAQSAVPMAVGLGAGMLAGPAAGAIVAPGIAGISSGATEYGQRRADGMSPADAVGPALFEGGVEMATEMLPFKFILDPATGTVGKRIAKGFAADAVGEQIASAAQGAGNVLFGAPDPLRPGQDLTLGNYAAEQMGPQAVDTLAASVVMAPLGAGATALNPGTPAAGTGGATDQQKLDLLNTIRALAPAFEGDTAATQNGQRAIDPNLIEQGNQRLRGGYDQIADLFQRTGTSPSPGVAVEPTLLDEVEIPPTQEPPPPVRLNDQLVDMVVRMREAQERAQRAQTQVDENVPVEEIEALPAPDVRLNEPFPPAPPKKGTKVEDIGSLLEEIELAPPPQEETLALPPPAMPVDSRGVAATPAMQQALEQRATQAERTGNVEGAMAMRRDALTPDLRPQPAQELDAAFAPPTNETNETSAGTPRLSRDLGGAQNRRGADPGKLQQAFDRVTSSLKGAVPVRVVATTSELPAHIRAKIVDEGAEGVDGVFDGDVVYMVADALPNPVRAARVFFHEQVGHAGLRGLFGFANSPEAQAAFDKLLDDIVASGRAGKFDLQEGKFYGQRLRALLRKIEKKAANADERAEAEELLLEARRQAAEEYIARTSERGARDPAGVMPRTRVMVAQALRKMPVLGKYFQNITREEVDYIIANARKYVERGGAATQDFRGSRFARGLPGDVRFSRRTSGKAPEIDARDDELTVAFKLLAQHDEFFSGEPSDAKEMSAIAATKGGRLEVQEIPVGGAFALGNTKRLWTIRADTGNTEASVVEQARPKNTVFIDISQSKLGGGGENIYQTVADFAHNNGKVFIGDPAGLSWVAQVRRTEQMLGSALRWGTTKHLAPHELQKSPEVKGARPLRWKVGDDAHNFRELVRSSYETYKNLVPEIGNIRYNFASGKFEGQNGSEYTTADFERDARAVRRRMLEPIAGNAMRASNPDAPAIPAGVRSLKRTVFADSVLRAKAEGRWRDVLAGIARDDAPRVHSGMRGALLSRRISERDGGEVGASERPADRSSRNESRGLTSSRGGVRAPRFSRNLLNAGFFSAVAEAVANAKMEIGQPAQWMNYLRNQPGVKQEELDWLDLEGWLKSEADAGRTKLRKDAVQAYVGDNVISIREMYHAGKKGEDENWADNLDIREGSWETEEPDSYYLQETANEVYLDDFRDEIRERMERDLEEGEEIDEDQLEREAEQRAYEAAERDYFNDDESPQSKWFQFGLPGGENYSGTMRASYGEVTVEIESREVWQGSWRQFHNTSLEAIVYEWAAENVDPSQSMIAEYGADAPPKWQDYTLDDADEDSTYREFILTLPRDENKPMQKQQEYRYTVHWPYQNPLAHARTQDKTTDEGKALFIEEVQSDWHHEKSMAREAVKNFLKEKEKKYSAELQRAREGGYKDATVELVLSENERAELGRLNAAVDNFPQAPMTATWPMLVLKNMLRFAVEQGYSMIAWTTGEQQNMRYSLSTYVDRIDYAKNLDGTFNWRAIGPTVNREFLAMELDELEKHVGKEVAAQMNAEGGDKGAESISRLDAELRELKQRMRQLPPERAFDQEGQQMRAREEQILREVARLNDTRYTHALEKRDLEIKGQGKKNLYDRQYVNEMNKYVKRWGARVERVDLADSPPSVEIEEITPEERQELIQAFNSGNAKHAPKESDKFLVYLLKHRLSPNHIRFAETEEEAKRIALNIRERHDNEKIGLQHVVRINDKMREGVRKGQPLFSRRINKLGLYSALEEQVGALTMKSAPPDGWKASLRGMINAGKVKADEVEWSGVMEWLDIQKGKVTRDQLVEYLKQGGVQIEETMRGGPRKAPQELIDYANAYAGDLDSFDGLMSIYDDAMRRAQRLQNSEPERAERFFRIAEMAEARAEDGQVGPTGTKHDRWTLPGGTNYREVLLRLPVKTEAEEALKNFQRRMVEKYPKEGLMWRRAASAEDVAEHERLKAAWMKEQDLPGFQHDHWEESNVLAHFRANDRSDADGKRVLFVEEIQSDWGQAGRDKGFAGGKVYEVVSKNLGAYITAFADRKTAEEYAERYSAVVREVDRTRGHSVGVPAAPFVTKTDSWVTLALKRIITMAVQEGHDRVAFVTGEQSADRYDLSREVGGVYYMQDGVGRGTLIATEPGKTISNSTRPVLEKDDIPPEKIEKYVGKENAKKLMQQEPDEDGFRGITGEGLKIGGEGMIAFYNQIVPATLKKLLPKLGGKLSSATITPTADDYTVMKGRGAFTIEQDINTPFEGEVTLRRRMPNGEVVTIGVMPREQAQEYIENPDNYPSQSSTHLAFDITPEMKAKVGQGVPLFSRKLPTKPGAQSTMMDAWRKKVGDPAWNKIVSTVKPILAAVKFADTVPTEFKRQMRAYRAEIQREARAIKGVAERASGLSPQERIMLSDFIERVMAPGTLPPSHIVDIATAVRAALEAQREELISMRMLSEDTRDRWGDEYIARYYAKHVIDKPWDKALRAAHKKIDGSHLRGRGMFEPVKRADIPKFEALGWEVRNDEGGDQVTMWRDFTREEREKMGEIRDGVYRFVRGYLESSRDIATGHLFEQMAQASYARDTDPGTGDYVEVPKTVIGGMTKGMTWQMKRNPQGKFAPRVAYRYGKLAGKWVPRDIWEQLAPMFEPRGALINAYLKGLSLWKEGKTVLNPVVHSNNIVSNVVSAYWALGPVGLSPATYKAVMDDYKAKGRFYQEAVDNGLFGTEYYASEIAALMPDLQQAALPVVSAGKVSKLLTFLSGKLKLAEARAAMQRAYEAEDQFFKLMLYRQARLNGATVDEAIDFAERFVFNYSDIPAGVRIAKNTAWPFASYTYKAIPMVARTMLQHPERMLATFLLFAGVNWLSFALLGDEGDEDEERKVMPEYMRGNTAVGAPKNIRMPLNFESGAAMYMDISRRLPLGDLYDVTNQAGGLALPAPLMPNNPLFTLSVGILANKDMFTGDEIVPEYDQDFPADKYSALGGYFARQVMPNNPLIPGSYSWNKLMNGIAGSTGEEFAGYSGMDYRGRMQSFPRAVLDTMFGVKLREVDVDTERQKRMSNQARLASDVKADIRRTGKDQSLTEEQREKRIQDLTTKIQRIMEKTEEFK